MSNYLYIDENEVSFIEETQLQSEDFESLIEQAWSRLEYSLVDVRKAIECASKKVVSEEDKAKYETTLAALHVAEFNPLPALELCLKTKDYFENVEGKSDALWCIRVYWSLGYAYRMSGNRAKGIEFFELTHRLSVESGNAFYKAMALSEIAWFHAKHEYFERANMLFTELGEPVLIAANYTARANQLMHQGKLDAALEVALEALKIAQEENSQFWKAIGSLRLADIYAERGEKELALKYIARYKELRDVSKPSLASQAYIREAEVYFKLGDYQKTITTSLAAENDLQLRGFVRWMYDLLSESHAELKQYKEAYEYRLKYEKVKDEMFESANHDKTTALEVLHETNLAKQAARLEQEKAEALTSYVQQLKNLNDEMKELSIRDPLTTLYNRRFFMDRLESLFRVAKDLNRNLCVAILDADHFKSVNDTFGHAVGDDVLKAIAKILNDVPREDDFAARYGGEEFVLVLTETSLQGAIKVCERIRKQIEDYDWNSIVEGLAVTVSVGVGETVNHETIESLMHTADLKLYEAKEDGRNRIKF